MLDESYKKLRINAALACATVHHSSHLGLSSVQSPHAFCTILAFSIHSFTHFLIQSMIRSALHYYACLLKEAMAHMRIHDMVPKALVVTLLLRFLF